jgi:ABC-type phosphate transport system substrate-binding protein
MRNRLASAGINHSTDETRPVHSARRKMRTSLRKVGTVVGALGAAAAITVAGVGVASADPANANAVKIAGTGSDTTQYIMDAIVAAYDKAPAHASTYVGSWDATGSATVNVKPSQGAACNIARPFGSGAGVTALRSSIAAGDGCLDFARSSAGKATDGSQSDLSFYQFARDAVSWVTFPSAVTPANLTTAQLTGIYNCTITDWGQVGGTAGKPILPYLPQSTSGTRKFFLGAIGVTSPGPCVNTLNNTLNENDGGAIAASAGANKNLVVAPFSVAQYLSDSRHLSPDIRGGFVLKKINGKAPTVKAKNQVVLNAGFTPAFVRLVYNVTSNSAPATVTNLFKTGGFVCSQRALILKWGFGAINNCGVKS